jgi:hypothetical protein
MDTTTHATPDKFRPMTRWMRVVGAFYLAQFVAMAIVHAPIRTFGPEGALDAADAGDPTAEFLVDTWTTFGIEVGAIGLALLVAAARPRYAWGVAATVVGIELTRGILNDVIFIARGINVTGYLVWIAIHGVVIVTGVVAMRRSLTARKLATT